MTGLRLRSPMKFLAVLLSVTSFLMIGQGAVSVAQAADPPIQPSQASEWETWPRRPAGTPGAAAAGEAAGEKTYAGLSAGTWGWIAGGVAAIALIAVAAGGGGGSDSVPAH